MVSKVTEPSGESCTTTTQVNDNQQALTPIDVNNTNFSSNPTDQLCKYHFVNYS